MRYGTSHAGGAGRARRRARPAGARADRPRRSLRRGPVRPGSHRGRHRTGARRRPRRAGRGARSPPGTGAGTRHTARAGRRRTAPAPAPAGRLGTGRSGGTAPVGLGVGAPGWRVTVPRAGARVPPVRTPVRGWAALRPAGTPASPCWPERGGRWLPAAVGWAALCRLVTDTHLRGERGPPVTTAAAVAQRCAVRRRGRPSPLVVLLGPDSDVGRALLARRPDRARALLAAWQRGAAARRARHRGGLPRRPGGHPRPSAATPRRLLGLADEPGVPAVLTAAVRHADPGTRAVVDVLDAARRLVALDTAPPRPGHRRRPTSRAPPRCTPSPARSPAATGGPRPTRWSRRDRWHLALARAPRTPAPTSASARSTCPSPSVARHRARHRARRRCSSSAAARRSPPATPGRASAELQAVERRLDDELEVIAELGYPTYFLTVAEVVDLIRDMGVRVAARGSGAGSAWSTTCSASAGSTRSATACSWSGSAPRCGPSCPTSTSTSSRPGAPRSTSGSSTASAASGSPASR